MRYWVKFFFYLFNGAFPTGRLRKRPKRFIRANRVQVTLSRCQCHRLLLISSMWTSNCDPVPTNDFLQDPGDDRLSLDEDLLRGLDPRSYDSDRGRTGSAGGLHPVTALTVLCTVTLFTMTILPFFRPSPSNTSRSSSTSSNVSSPDPSRNPSPPPLPPPAAAALGANRGHIIL